MHVVPRHEVLEKLAAIQYADALGRQFAQDRVIEKLAEMAGISMAHDQNKMDMVKLAQSMVYSGEMSLEEYEMLKEAGWVGKVLKRFGRGAAAKATSAASSVGKGVSSATSRVGRIFKKPPKADWVAKPARPKMSSNAAYNSRRGTPGAAPTPKSQAAAQAPGKVAPAPASGARPPGPDPRHYASTTQSAASPGNVAPATKSAPASTGAPEKYRGASLGRALPYAAVGALGYGAYKAVPWAARQLEATSTTPMAYGAGWSPVPYGYGHSPYGSGVQTMGMGT
jgi:hypothetical protein